MSAILTLDQVQANLKQLIDDLAPGQEIVIIENEQPVARLVGDRAVRQPRPAPGLGKGSVLYMSPDFDEPLDDFREYVE